MRYLPALLLALAFFAAIGAIFYYPAWDTLVHALGASALGLVLALIWLDIRFEVSGEEGPAPVTEEDQADLSEMFD
jgi:hypothetical protein